VTAATAPTTAGERRCPPKTQHLAVVGPTASGKSTLALAAAELLGDVEIVAVDSMQVYRGMDIGTAKPTPAEQAAVPHHLIDLADPGEHFFRGPVPGRGGGGHRRHRGPGTPGPPGRRHRLYFHSVVDGYALPPGDERRRAELEAEAEEEGGLARLMEELQALDPVPRPGSCPTTPAVSSGRWKSSGDRAAVLLLRARGAAGSWPPAPRTDGRLWIPRRWGPANRRPHRGHDRGGVRRRGGRPGPRSRRPVGHGPEAIGYKEILAHLAGTGRCPTPGGASPIAPASWPAASACGSGATAGSRGSAATGIPRHPSCCSGNVECTLPAGDCDHSSFSKLHATGNDFLVLVDLEARFGSPAATGWRRACGALCDRRRGVGADGLIRLLAGRDGADCEMELTNADGGLAEISGNGLRCWPTRGPARLGAGDRPRRRHRRRPAGDVACRRPEDGEVDYAEAEMGLVMFTPEMIPWWPTAPSTSRPPSTASLPGDAAGVGNPHYVVFVDDPDAVPLDRHVPCWSTTPASQPHHVEMVVPTASGLRMRIWERAWGDRLLRVGGLRRGRRGHAGAWRRPG